jgi:hypothetical protein
MHAHTLSADRRPKMSTDIFIRFAIFGLVTFLFISKWTKLQIKVIVLYIVYC